MQLKTRFGVLLCFIATAIGASAVSAAAPKLPATAIGEDTFFVATVDAAKADPDTLGATVKAALGDNAAALDGPLGEYKTRYDKYAGAGVQFVTVVLSGDPDQQHAGPEPIFYLQFKPDSDQTVVEKLIRDEEGENNPAPMEITHDGDYMLVRKQGLEPPAAASDDRTKLFTEAFGDSDKPAVGALIFNPAMIQSAQKGMAQGAPPALGTLVNDSKWFRIELTTGDAVKADITIQTADEDAGKRMTDGITALGNMLAMQVAQMRQSAAQVPQVMKIADAMDAAATALKQPQQNGATVTLTADAKAVGGILTGMVGRKMDATPAPNP